MRENQLTNKDPYTPIQRENKYGVHIFCNETQKKEITSNCSFGCPSLCTAVETFVILGLPLSDFQSYLVQILVNKTSVKVWNWESECNFIITVVVIIIMEPFNDLKRHRVKKRCYFTSDIIMDEVSQ